MFFTPTVPTSQGDRIRLYLDSREARRASHDGGLVYGVAVDLDRSGRRLRSDSPSEPAYDPLWGTPAYFEDFRHIVARGPIPDELFIPLPIAHAVEDDTFCPRSCISR